MAKTLLEGSGLCITPGSGTGGIAGDGGTCLKPAKGITKEIGGIEGAGI